MRLRRFIGLILAAALLLSLGVTAYAEAEPSFTYELLLTDGSGAPVNPTGRQLQAGDTLNVEIKLNRTDKAGSYHAWGLEFQLLSNGLSFTGGGESFPGGPAVTFANYDEDPTVDLQVGFAYFDSEKKGIELSNPSVVGRWSYTVTDPDWTFTVPVHLVYVAEGGQAVPITRVNLKLNPGEGSIVGTDVSGEYDEGSQVTLPDAARPGYDFGGWSDGSKVYPAGTGYIVIGNTTLTAVWTPRTAEVTLTLDVNGGTLAGADASGSYTAGTAVTLPAASRTGYSFGGWSDGSKSWPAGSYTVHETVTLTAQWTKAEEPGPGPTPGPGPGPGPGPATYQLTLDVNGGVLRGTDVSGEYEAGTTVTLPSAIRDDYDFGGWSDGSRTWPAGSYTVNGSAVLKAQWTKTEESISVQREKHFNYIQGYPDGTVKPLNPITRAEVATIFYRLLTEESRSQYKTTENRFGDVSAEAWYNTEVSTLANAGILVGYEDGSFRPNRSITRAEMATIISRFAKLSGDVEISFSDIAGHWAENYIMKAASNGWILGYEDGSFRPDRTITRAETVTLINRVLQRRVHREEDLLKDMIRFPDNANPEAWYYYEIQEAANHHEYMVGDDGWETWTGKLPEIIY